MDKKRIRLRSIFLRRLLGGLLLPFVLILLVIALQIIKDVYLDKRDDYLTMAEMTADNVNEAVQKYVSVVETAAYDENVTSMDCSRAEPYLNRIIADSGSVWSHFSITDSRGTEIAHTDGKKRRGKSIAGRDYYKIPWNEGTTAVCEPAISKSTGRKILAIGVPVKSGGVQTGVLIGFVRLERIIEVLEDGRVTDNGSAFMLNSDGMLSAHFNEDIVLRQNWVTGECDGPSDSDELEGMTAKMKKAVTNMTNGERGVLSGIDYIYAYAPVGIGGMSICISAPCGEAFQIIQRLLAVLAKGALAAAAAGAAASVYMSRRFAAPFAWIAEQVKALAHGHTGVIERKTGYTCAVEMAELRRSVDFLASSLESMLSKLDVESKNMLSNVGTVDTLVTDSDKSASDISAAMRGLEADMEEVSSKAEAMSRSVRTAAETIFEIARNSEHGASYAGESQAKAAEKEQMALEQKASVNEKADELRSIIKETAAYSRQVEDIAGLAREIFDIVSRTNLLALNASIEAVRAGEAGRGFVDAAEEIRGLAERSRQTADRIREISGKIIGAVNRLVSDAGTVLEFVDKTVLQDYDKFAEAAQLYREDSIHLESVLSASAAQAGGLREDTDILKEGSCGVLSTAEQSARGIVRAAESADGLLANLGVIEEQMVDNMRISSELRQEWEKFQQ